MPALTMHLEHLVASRRLSAYLDDELSVRQRKRVTRHVSQCPECGPTLRGLIRITAALRGLGRSTRAQRSVVPLVLERIRDEHAHMSHERSRRPR